MKRMKQAKQVGFLIGLALLLSGCGGALMTSAESDTASSSILHPAGAEEFNAITASGTVLVDFYADWCGPCRRMSPVLEELAGEQEENIKVVKVNVDKHRDLAQQFKVSSIPYLVIFKDGQISAARAGYQDKDQLLGWLGITSAE
jgi:thioredoxin 1